MAGQEFWAALDVQNAVLIEAYRRESARMQRRDLQRQYTILDGLVEGRGADPDSAGGPGGARDRRGGRGRLRGGAVRRAGEPRAVPRGPAGPAGPVSHWHVRGGVSFGLVAGPLAYDAGPVERLRGRPGGGGGVRRRARRLRHRLPARGAGRRHPAPGSSAAVAVTDRLPEVLLAGSPQVTPLLVQETLGAVQALPEHQAETLLETLRAVLAHDGSPTHAASALFCHRNTVIYRIKQIEELTGRCLTDPRDKLMLSLGLVALAR